MTKIRSNRDNGPVDSAELVMPHGMLSQITDYLLRDKTKEYACYVLCGHYFSGRRLSLLPCYFVFPQTYDYERQSIGMLQVKRELVVEILAQCKANQLSLVDIHSHPFVEHGVHFSSTDESDELDKANWFAENIPSAYYGSVVFGQRSYAARLRSTNERRTAFPLTVRALDVPLSPRTKSDNGAPSDLGAVIRQVQAFGEEGQHAIAEARVGIVGLGGVGSIMASNLARLGVRDFVLIDPDRVELTNLNRMAGMRRSDVFAARRKVTITRREIRLISPTAACVTVCADVTARKAWRLLLDRDIVIVATDNNYSRMFLNAFSQQYLIPQISIGSLIEVDGSKLEEVTGHIRTMLPGYHQKCLICSGIISAAQAYYELLPEGDRRVAVQRGYIRGADVADPSVIHLNGVLTNLATVEFHNLFCCFKEAHLHLYYDALNQEILSINDGSDGCAVCSIGGGYFGRGDTVVLDHLFREMLP